MKSNQKSILEVYNQFPAFEFRRVLFKSVYIHIIYRAIILYVIKHVLAHHLTRFRRANRTEFTPIPDFWAQTLLFQYFLGPAPEKVRIYQAVSGLINRKSSTGAVFCCFGPCGSTLARFSHETQLTFVGSTK